MYASGARADHAALGSIDVAIEGLDALLHRQLQPLVPDLAAALAPLGLGGLVEAERRRGDTGRSAEAWAAGVDVAVEVEHAAVPQRASLMLLGGELPARPRRRRDLSSTPVASSKARSEVGGGVFHSLLSMRKLLLGVPRGPTQRVPMLRRRRRRGGLRGGKLARPVARRFDRPEGGDRAAARRQRGAARRGSVTRFSWRSRRPAGGGAHARTSCCWCLDVLLGRGRRQDVLQSRLSSESLLGSSGCASPSASYPLPLRRSPSSVERLGVVEDDLEIVGVVRVPDVRLVQRDVEVVVAVVVVGFGSAFGSAFGGEGIQMKIFKGAARSSGSSRGSDGFRCALVPETTTSGSRQGSSLQRVIVVA